MDGEEGGVAVTSRLRPELEGGDVDGTVRLTTGMSSPSPVGTQGHQVSAVGHSEVPGKAAPTPPQGQAHL